MKQLLLVFAFIGCVITSARADEPNQYDGTIFLATEQPVSVTVLTTSSSVVEFLVEANDVVNDVCNYFNGSWVDTGLKFYCTLGGDVYTCTTYKIVKMACSVSGAIKLYMEGDINNAMKRVLTTGADIWSMTKVGDKIKLSPSDRCVITPNKRNGY